MNAFELPLKVGFDGSVEVGGVEIDGALYEGVTLLEELRCEPCDE